MKQKEEKMEFNYDVVVIGAGHAGCEAAAASAKLGAKTCLVTMADYIATDRSAMMRELKRLREEEIVFSDGRKFTLELL